MPVSDANALRGMAWDHPRGRDPLRAISEKWSLDSGMTADWDARPLKDFEDQALEELATAYDLVLIDHPFTQTAAESGLVVAVDDWVSPGYLADQREHSVGPSFASYSWAGKQWALAIDAACQVSALRRDLWDEAGAGDLPETWEEVARLARSRSGAASQVAVPLNPNHSYCAFLSVGVTIAGEGFWRAGEPVEQDAGQASLEFLRSLAEDLHEASAASDPIGISDLMSGTGQILYVPLMFGYSNYARAGFRRSPLRFGNAPSGPSGIRGSVLGGVGLALSARSAHPEEAASLARRIGSADVQAGLYVRSGGQPGHGAAWQSAQANRMVDGFFIRTRDTMEQAFTRPCITGHRAFQPLAGELIHDFLWKGDMSVSECLQRFNDLSDKLLRDWKAPVS